MRTAAICCAVAAVVCFIVFTVAIEGENFDDDAWRVLVGNAAILVFWPLLVIICLAHVIVGLWYERRRGA